MEASVNMARKELTREELAEVVEAAQAGDEACFEQLLDATEKYVRRLALTVVGPQLLEDVMQESYLSVYRYLDRVRNPMAFLSWLSRLVLHTAYQIKKKHPAREELPLSLASADSSEQVAKSVTLRNALARLPRKHADVLILHELIGLNHSEVGLALRIPEGTARSRLFTARKRLAMILEGS